MLYNQLSYSADSVKGTPSRTFNSKGAAKRRKGAKSSAAIGHMPCGNAQCQDCGQATAQLGGQQSLGKQTQARPRKRGKTSHTWRLDPDGGPAVTEGAGKLLSDLLQVFGRVRRQQLEKVLLGCWDSDLHLSLSTDIAATVNDIQRCTKGARINELHLMISFVQLAVNVNRYVNDSMFSMLFSNTML